MGQTKWGQARPPSHVRIYRRQMQSLAWRHLSGSAVKVLLLIADMENGSNNGTLFLSDRTAAEQTGLARNTTRKALQDLLATGFIYCTERGGFSRKTPHAACYGITWQAGPEGTPWRAPSHAYEQWRPDGNAGNTRAQFPTETGSISATETETFPLTGPETAPAMMEKRLVSVTSAGSEIEPHTNSHTHRSEQASIGNRKHGPETWAAFADALRDQLRNHLSQSAAGEQTRLAQAIGCPGGTLSKFAAGKNLPAPYVDRLAKALIRPAAAPAQSKPPRATLTLKRR